MSYFLSEIPGASSVRVENPTGITAPEGSHVMVLGDDSPGFTRRHAPGDRMGASQNAAIGDGKLLRFTGRIRGPNRPPPAVSVLENFALSDGEELHLELDNSGTVQVIVFQTAQFAVIGAARAHEVVAAINTQLVGGVAGLTGDGRVEVRTNKEGRRARVRVDAGTTALALNLVEWAWFARLYVNGTKHAETEIRAGETRDLTDMAASVAVGGVPSLEFRLELDEK